MFHKISPFCEEHTYLFLTIMEKTRMFWWSEISKKWKIFSATKKPIPIWELNLQQEWAQNMVSLCWFSRGVYRTSSKVLRRVNLALKNDNFSSLIYKFLHGIILKSAYLSDKTKKVCKPLEVLSLYQTCRINMAKMNHFNTRLHTPRAICTPLALFAHPLLNGCFQYQITAII